MIQYAFTMEKNYIESTFVAPKSLASFSWICLTLLVHCCFALSLCWKDAERLSSTFFITGKSQNLNNAPTPGLSMSSIAWWVFVFFHTIVVQSQGNRFQNISRDWNMFLVFFNSKMPVDWSGRNFWFSLRNLNRLKSVWSSSWTKPVHQCLLFDRPQSR